MRELAAAPARAVARRPGSAGHVPVLIIAAGLWVLAWAERSRALAVIAAVYTAAALLSSLDNIENVLFRPGWNPRAATGA